MFDPLRSPAQRRIVRPPLAPTAAASAAAAAMASAAAAAAAPAWRVGGGRVGGGGLALHRRAYGGDGATDDGSDDEASDGGGGGAAAAGQWGALAELGRAAAWDELGSAPWVELGDQCVWSASSSKAGHGLGLVRDRSVATYWQSDGTAPHTVTLEWPFRACVAELLFFFDRATDDSYTPEELRLSAGYAPDRLLQFHVHGPGASAADGWIRLSFDPPVLTHVLEIAITRNHQNGRDSRLHQVCVFGSRPELTGIASPPFSHPALVQWASIR